MTFLLFQATLFEIRQSHFLLKWCADGVGWSWVRVGWSWEHRIFYSTGVLSYDSLFYLISVRKAKYNTQC